MAYNICQQHSIIPWSIWATATENYNRQYKDRLDKEYGVNITEIGHYPFFSQWCNLVRGLFLALFGSCSTNWALFSSPDYDCFIVFLYLLRVPTLNYQSTNHLNLVYWTWKLPHRTPTASTVTWSPCRHHNMDVQVTHLQKIHLKLKQKQSIASYYLY